MPSIKGDVFESGMHEYAGVVLLDKAAKAIANITGMTSSFRFQRSRGSTRNQIAEKKTDPDIGRTPLSLSQIRTKNRHE